MGEFNTLVVPESCSACGKEAHASVEIFFGYVDDDIYELGEKVTWMDGRAREQGGRPPDGSFRFRGHAECSSCGAGRDVVVEVVGDRLVGISEYSPGDAVPWK